MRITDITVEHLKSPLGIDEPQPRLSYIIQSEDADTVQVRREITVSQGDGGIVWHEASRASATQLIPITGRLAPCTRYEVRVRVLDNHGHREEAGTFFETGLFGNFGSARFIAAPKETECPVMRKGLLGCAIMSKKHGGVARARLYITALGLYSAYIGGERVGDSYMTPGFTDYNHRLQYQTYDVTQQTRRALEKTLENADSGREYLEVMLAQGWYSGVFGCVNKREVYGQGSALLCRLELLFNNGQKYTLCSDGSWHWGTGRLLTSGREAGEDWDMRRCYEDKGTVRMIKYDASRLVWSVCPPVRIIKQLPAVNKIITPSGKQVLDFGQNLTGFVRFSCRAPKGRRITLKHCEVLGQDGEIYTANLRTARAADTYISDGSASVLAPEFTFHGFRYVQVEGTEAKPEDFTACVLCSDLEQTGSFECSDPDVNRLWRNILWGQRGNFVDIPTDCPQRDERLGWTGDAQVFAPTAACNMDVSAFFTKWLADLSCEQTAQKGVPHMVPDLFDAAGAAAWGDAATVIPWVMYMCYGDRRLLERQYPSMKGWVDYIRSRSRGFLWQGDFQYGDWLGMDREGDSWTGATDPDLVATACFARCAHIVSLAAQELGKRQEALEYRKLNTDIKRAFRREYVTAGGRVVSDTQTACTLALSFDLVRRQDREKVLARLCENLERHGRHMVTGFVGTPLLCPCLTENGRHDLAAALLMQRDYPSWLYEVKMGATTVWERWNGIKPDGSFETADMNSFNHYAYGSVGQWLYQNVAGITPLAPGYAVIGMKPMPTDGLSQARACIKTPYGQTECGWQRTQDGIRLACRVPCCTTAQLTLPWSGETLVLGSGSYCFDEGGDYSRFLKVPKEPVPKKRSSKEKRA